MRATGNGPTLGAVFGVIQAGFIASHAQHGGCQAHADPCFVHHVEHVAQTTAWFANQVTHCARPIRTCVVGRNFELAFAKIQQRVGGTTPSAFVIQTRQRHIVANTCQLTFGVHHFLGHDEQGNAFNPRYQLAIRAWDFGQNQMNDVLCEFMFTRRDPHLVTFETIARTQGILLE